MKINKKLNIVIPIESDDGTIFVHSTPISRDVFEKYVFVVSKTLSVLYDEGLTVFAGPRVASMMLKQISEKSGIWEDVEKGLMNEIRRLTNVVIKGDNGWETVMYSDALKRDKLSQEDVDLIEGNIVFFICVSAMHDQKQAAPLLAGMNQVWDTQSTYLNCMEWANSLLISTTEENTGETAIPLSIPY